MKNFVSEEISIIQNSGIIVFRASRLCSTEILSLYQ